MMAHTFSSNAADMANNNQVSSSADLNPVIKIKQENIDFEIENEIGLIKQNIKSEPPDINNTTEMANGNTKHKNVSAESDDDYDDSSDTDSSSLDQNDEDESDKDEDDKKHIEPVKSSNEILTELFNVFNVAPPEELLDDKNLIKKTKRDRKEKKRKHKRQKTEGINFDVDNYEALSGEKYRHKKSKKKHKHKSKGSSKDKEKDNVKNKVGAGSKEAEKWKIDKKCNDSDTIRERDRRKEENKSVGRAKSKDGDRIPGEFPNRRKSPTKLSNEHKRHHTKDDDRADSVHKRKKTEDKDNKLSSFSDGLRDSERSEKEKIKKKSEYREKKSHRYSENVSDISISDEEFISKEKESRSGYSKRKVHNSFYHGLNRSRSREKERDNNWGRSKDNYRDRERDRIRDKDRDRNRDGSYRSRGFSRRYQSRYSRSRSRSRSHDLGIDKKRLLEIARKNAISMFKRGNLPGCDNMSQEIRDKVLLKMRYGGRTVEDLTAFCKKISNGENLSGLSSDEDSDVDKAGNSKAFHHPFQLKEREPIVMHIRNSKPILPALANTEEQAKAITMQFPVSSGQQHRMTEHWVAVESKDNLAPLPVLPAASQSTTIFKSNVAKNALGKPLPITEEQEPAFKPITTQNTEAQVETASVFSTPIGAEVALPSHESSPVSASQNVLADPVAEATEPFIADVPVPSANFSVFPETSSATLDVSSIISKRLNAMRRLQENPLDSEAIKMMYNSQKEMSSWASSKYLPGQFTGSTGANVLKPNELHSGYQVWARRDQLTSTKPVTGGMGMHLLQKMGWRPGEGLGREKNGSLQPLLLDVKLDKRGLVSQDDCNRKGVPIKRRGAVQSIQLAQQSLEEKHPVCLLNELTSKRKWTPPLYTLVNENGPSHSKMFLFSVQVNGKTFTPEKACNTKKEAKMIAAKYCLQQIGILPIC